MQSNEALKTSHAELVALAREWLKRNQCSIVTSEVKAMGLETPDALGWHSEKSIMIECKTSRADFLQDKKKYFRTFPEKGVGDYRYFLTTPGVIKSADELPAGFGWLEYQQPEGTIKKRLAAQLQPLKYQQGETYILLSLIKRIGRFVPPGAGEGTSIRCYVYQTKNTAVLEIEEEPQ